MGRTTTASKGTGLRQEVGRLRYRAGRRFALATARLRALPDFLLIGVGRSGTTSLYAYLVQHPDVLPAVCKEVNYFDAHYHRGELWYRSHFPTRARMAWASVSGGRTITGEASPSYLHFPEAAERVRADLPEARFIITLRDPVERAFSQYRHKVRNGVESLGFREALDAEPERATARRCLEQRRSADGGRGEAVPIRVPPSYDYVGRGMYAEQLRRWFALFPRQQFLVLRGEDLFDDPARVYGRVLDFLELRHFERVDFRVWQRGDGASIPDDVRRDLIRRFEDANEELFELTGIDYRGGRLPP